MWKGAVWCLGGWLAACGGTPQVAVTIADDPAIQAFAQIKNNGGDLYFRISFKDADGTDKTIGFPQSCSTEPPDAGCGYSYGNSDPELDLNRKKEFNIATEVRGSYTIPEGSGLVAKAYVRKPDTTFIACGWVAVLNKDGGGGTIQLIGTCPL